MAGASEDPNGGPVVGINVTPLVDVTLVLLIIFIVTAKVVVTPALPADLPRGTTTKTVETTLSVIVPADGAWSMNGVPLSPAIDARDAGLVSAAVREVAKNPKVRAVVSAGGAVPHRDVFHVLDSLRRAGVEHVAFGSLPEAP